MVEEGYRGRRTRPFMLTWLGKDGRDLVSLCFGVLLVIMSKESVIFRSQRQQRKRKRQRLIWRRGIKRLKQRIKRSGQRR
jgi:hypothetical protein